MSFSLANNVSSLTARNNLGRSSRALDRSLERLSSGFKVNRGADGPAALVISEKQRAQIAGLSQAIDNAEKAISLVQTAEGALSEVNSLLVKIRSLALDSANAGVNDVDAMRANQQEISNALDTIRRIGENTQFGIKRLLDGSNGINGTPTDANVTFLKGTSQTNAGSYDIEVTAPAERAVQEAPSVQGGPLAAAEELVINGIRITLNAGSTQQDVINRINTFTDDTGVIADANGAGGATRLYTTDFGLDAEIKVTSNVTAATTSTGFGDALADVTGANLAGTVAGQAFVGDGRIATMTTGAATGLTFEVAIDAADITSTVSGTLGDITVVDDSLVFQIGANQYQTTKIAIGQVLPTSLGLNNQSEDFDSLADLDVSSEDKAQQAIGVIDLAIDEITSVRGELGAFQQNTLDSSANSLRVTLENTVNAESVIRDTDFAEEIAVFTNQQLLVQAGTSVLQSANQTSELVLQLLG